MINKLQNFIKNKLLDLKSVYIKNFGMFCIKLDKKGIEKENRNKNSTKSSKSKHLKLLFVENGKLKSKIFLNKNKLEISNSQTSGF